MSHTPGHWEARKGDVFNADRTWGVVVPLRREACIAIDGDDSCYGHRTEVIAEVMSGPTDEADARLIACAPDLLAACKEMAEILHSMSECGAGAAQGIAAPYFNVIRKAEGKE